MLERNLGCKMKSYPAMKRWQGWSNIRTQYLQQLNRVAEVNGRLKQTRVDRLRQSAAQNQQIQQLKAELEELETKITETSGNLRYQVLRSPVDGIVFDLKPRGEGYAAQGTETVMKIVPYDTLEAKVEIPSRKIGFVRVGMPAGLSIVPFHPLISVFLKRSENGSDTLPPSQQTIARIPLPGND